MAASAPETTVPGRLTTLLLGVILLGAVLLIVAEFLPLYEIRVVTAVPKGGHHSAGGHHGYALLVIRGADDAGCEKKRGVSAARAGRGEVSFPA